MAVPFQRCKDRSRGDRLRQQELGFGGVDEEPGFTNRQVRGATIVGTVAGAVLGGPMVAAAVASSLFLNDISSTPLRNGFYVYSSD